MKKRLKTKAIKLRKKGLSYSEILAKVPVARSTLSLWLRSVGLSKRQKLRLTGKRLSASHRGGQVRKKQRLIVTKSIISKAQKDINAISIRDLWLMGIMLYWAEGSKQKPSSPSERVSFSNSDPQMIKLFLLWLNKCLDISVNQIDIQIYIHVSHQYRINAVKQFWAQTTGFPISKFDKIYFKKNKLRTKRRNKGNTYFGLVRIQVQSSTNLNRTITGWIKGVCKQCRVV